MKDKEIIILAIVAAAAFWFYTTGKATPGTFDGTQGVPAGSVGNDLTYLSYAYTPAYGASSPLPAESQGYDGIATGGCNTCSMLSNFFNG